MSCCVSYLTLLMANIKNPKKIATDSNYLRCHALLTALHFPLEITWSCKQDRKERYWGQQFWQMEMEGAIHSTKVSGNSGPKLNGSVRSNRKSFEKNGPPFEVVLFSRSDRSEFWLNGSRPDISVRPTEMTRPVTVDHLQSWSRIFRSDQTEMVRSI